MTIVPWGQYDSITNMCFQQQNKCSIYDQLMFTSRTSLGTQCASNLLLTQTTGHRAVLFANSVVAFTASKSALFVLQSRKKCSIFRALMDVVALCCWMSEEILKKSWSYA